MKALVVGGTPSSGKTRVILWLSSRPKGLGKMGIVKLDCLQTTDDAVFRARGLAAMKLLAGRFCPDHELMERLPEVFEWSTTLGLDTLVVETAGLCTRCAPYVKNAVAICVLDCTCGIHGPNKLGPLLTDADICVFTKGDLVSQAEREVFAQNVASRNPTAIQVWMNGLTGEGTEDLIESLGMGPPSGDFKGTPAFRTPLPQMYCSYCFGRSDVGITSL